MDLSPINGKKITQEQCKRRREGGLCMYSVDSRHLVASYPRQLRAASGQVEVTPFWDSGKGKEVEQEVESGKV
jgi:hypothetical protein